MANTSIKPCTCEHEYQDKVYGKHLRGCNKTYVYRVRYTGPKDRRKT